MRFRLTIIIICMVASLLSACRSADRPPIASSDPRPAPLVVPVGVTVEARPSYRLGLPMPVSVTVKNVGSTPLQLPEAMAPPLHWLDLSVVGPDGTNVEGRAHPGKIGGWDQLRTFHPDQSETVSADVDLLFRIKTTGTYELKAIFGRSPLPTVRPYGRVESPIYRFEVTAQ